MRVWMCGCVRNCLRLWELALAAAKTSERFYGDTNVKHGQETNYQVASSTEAQNWIHLPTDKTERT